MKLNLLLLSAAALVNAAAAAVYTTQVILGDAGNYVILAETGITNVPTSAVTGNMGLYSSTSSTTITSADITGFGLVLHNSGVHSSSPQVAPVPASGGPSGNVYASDYLAPTPSNLLSAVDGMKEAYTDIEDIVNDPANANTVTLNLGGGKIGGLTLTSGVYNFTSDINIGAEMYFDGEESSGDSAAVFVIKTSGNIVQAAAKKVILTGGALAENIFWQVAGNVAVGAGAHLEGVILAKNHATFKTGSSLNGRILTQTACNLQMATITEP
jgi:hypothetical protein